MRAIVIRLLNLFALLGAVAWLARAPDWEPLVTSFALLAAFLGQELWPALKPLGNDKKLFECFLSDFPSNGRSARFLDEHDIGGSFRSDDLNELYNFLNTWNDAEHEFHNKKLEAQRKKLWKAANKFCSELSLKVYAGREGFLTMDLKDFEDRPEALATRDNLNNLATQVFREHQEFVRIGRFLA